MRSGTGRNAIAWRISSCQLVDVHSGGAMYAAHTTKEVLWQITSIHRTAPFFERTSKRRKGFPSETQVKRGVQIVRGFKELIEKLGRNDPCPCGSTRKFKNCCMHSGCFRRQPPRLLFSASKARRRNTRPRAPAIYSVWAITKVLSSAARSIGTRERTRSNAPSLAGRSSAVRQTGGKIPSTGCCSRLPN